MSNFHRFNNLMSIIFQVSFTYVHNFKAGPIKKFLFLFEHNDYLNNLSGLEVSLIYDQSYTDKCSMIGSKSY